MLIAEVILGSFTIGIGVGIVGIVFAFIYNKIYIRGLLEKNWESASKTDEDILKQKGIMELLILFLKMKKKYPNKH